MTTEGTFEGWAIVELMGHRRLAGYVSEQEFAGSSFVRLDVPDPDGPEGAPGESPLGHGFRATQFYSPAAVYCITPTTEEIARRVARGSQPTPVQRWELPAAEPDEALA